MKTQLLSTFCKLDELHDVCNRINDKYEVVSGKIFVLENVDDPTQLILTYNVVNVDLSNILESTISVHRKKQTNTIYTINALNQLIKKKNNGILDKRFQIEWMELENVILVTAYGKLKTIPTQVREILILGEHI